MSCSCTDNEIWWSSWRIKPELAPGLLDGGRAKDRIKTRGFQMVLGFPILLHIVTGARMRLVAMARLTVRLGETSYEASQVSRTVVSSICKHARAGKLTRCGEFPH